MEPLGFLESKFNDIEKKLDALTRRSEDIQRLLNNLAPNEAKDSDWKKIKEIAKITGLTEGYIYQLVAERKIPFTKFNKSLRFSSSEIQIWMMAGRPSIHQQAIDQLSADYIVGRGSDLKSAS